MTSEQYIILPISDKYNDYAKKIMDLLKNYDICGLIDERSERTGRKIRDAELSKVPFIIVIGEKEVKENLMSVRRHGGEDLGQLSLEDFTLMIKDEIDKSLV